MPTIMGIAVINTMDTTYDSFLESPLMAPDVAIAADTPQMETALEIIIVSSSSTPNLRQSQNAKYHTESTTISDWTKPSEPARRISEKMTLVPNSTNPTFTSISALSDCLNHSGSRNRLPTANPINSPKITASNPKSFRKRFPASSSATTVSANTKGNPINCRRIGLPVSAAPAITNA